MRWKRSKFDGRSQAIFTIRNKKPGPCEGLQDPGLADNDFPKKHGTSS